VQDVHVRASIMTQDSLVLVQLLVLAFGALVMESAAQLG
jgi:hypothetical protein